MSTASAKILSQNFTCARKCFLTPSRSNGTPLYGVDRCRFLVQVAVIRENVELRRQSERKTGKLRGWFLIGVLLGGGSSVITFLKDAYNNPFMIKRVIKDFRRGTWWGRG
jgi:hypothetical protein